MRKPVSVAGICKASTGVETTVTSGAGLECVGAACELGYKSVSGHGWQREKEVYQFDLFPGRRIHTTELMDDPLEKDRHTLIKEFSHIYLGVLNDYDLIVSKLFRGTQVDFEDTISLAFAHKKSIDLKKLREHFFEMLSYHPVGEDRVKGNWDVFEKGLKEVDP